MKKQTYYLSDTYKGTFRRLKIGEMIKPTDLVNSKSNTESDGWRHTMCAGLLVCQSDMMWFYRRIHCKA
jgi:hypothetical protein